MLTTLALVDTIVLAVVITAGAFLIHLVRGLSK